MQERSAGEFLMMLLSALYASTIRFHRMALLIVIVVLMIVFVVHWKNRQTNTDTQRRSEQVQVA